MNFVTGGRSSTSHDLLKKWCRLFSTTSLLYWSWWFVTKTDICNKYIKNICVFLSLSDRSICFLTFATKNFIIFFLPFNTSASNVDFDCVNTWSFVKIVTWVDAIPGLSTWVMGSVVKYYLLIYHWKFMCEELLFSSGTVTNLYSLIKWLIHILWTFDYWVVFPQCVVC